MADLEQQIAGTLDDEDKTLLKEASACLEAGANRAAYITVWLSIAESLRRRFAAAAVQDQKAGRILGEIERRENQHKAVDSLLIARAQEYGFITDAQATRLRHIYENRCVFGHPYEQSPNVQLIETAATEAVDMVLGRPIALRHGYLKQQIQRVTEDPTFLNDEENAVVEFAALVHARSAANLRVWFVEKFIDALDAVYADPSLDLLQRRGEWFLRAFLRTDLSIFDEWEATNDLPDHQPMLSQLLADPTLFPSLSHHARDIVVNALAQHAATRPRLLRPAFGLLGAGVLTEAQEQMANEALDGLALERLSGTGLPLSTFWQRVVADLTTYNWDWQNRAIGAIRMAGPSQLHAVDDLGQEKLGRNVMQAAEGHAFAAMDLLEEIASSEGWPEAFIRGIVLEPFANEEGELRLKLKQLGAAVKSLRGVTQLERASIVDNLDEVLRAGHPKTHILDVEIAQAIEALEDVQADLGLNRLAETANLLRSVDVTPIE